MKRRFWRMKMRLLKLSCGADGVCSVARALSAVQFEVSERSPAGAC